MFQRFHAMREEREGGFTLIELLVVILIIAILAAIAIPVFLQQRRKGWVAQAESTLKNAATAQESYATGDGDGAYTTATATLQSEGFRYAAAEITFGVDWVDLGEDYCMEADSQNDTAIDLFYLSDTGSPEEGECPADAD
jgi:prepilin-type N-terminal cleavage/methylation domain-containing protein